MRLTVPDCEQDNRTVGMQASHREQHRIAGGGIEPLGVIHDREHRLLLGGGGQKAKGRSRNRERVGRRRRTEGERGIKGGSLRRRDRAHELEHRVKQLRQADQKAQQKKQAGTKK